MRDDITNNLVHLSKGKGEDTSKHREEALNNLLSILEGEKLIGGTKYIRGKHKCVCFSEAPIGKLSYILEAKQNDFKYQPYGIMVSKRWLWNKGGRPVIYGPRDDYEDLPERLQFRHAAMQYGPKYDIDYTWEREWRIKTEELQISPSDVTIVVPTRKVKNLIEDELKKNSLKTGWHYIVLADLGVEISEL